MSEYFVEVTPGRELVYQTPLSLRAAMRSGEITADSRIFHRATRTWISITEHPEYKRFLSEVHPRPRFEPLPYEPVAPTAVPPRPRFLGNLAERGAAFATSSWASLKKSFEPKARKSAGPKQPARPSKPPPPAQPSPPTRQAEPPRQGAPRKGWTFLP